MPSKIVARTTSSPPAGSGVTVKGSRLTNVEVDENFTSLYTHKLEASSNLSDLTNTTTARTNLGLGNVENKSSATIRSELTSDNVTAALGYTPPTPTGTGASGTWGISITGNAATLGGWARRLDLADYTTWDASKSGPVGWYGFAGGPGGGNYHYGFRTAMADTNYGMELACKFDADELYYRRYSAGYQAWKRLANWDTHVRAAVVADWGTLGVGVNVVGMLGWKNYQNGHVIFDASNSTSPTGSAIDPRNPGVAWAAGVGYPALMGWNGSNTYGLRVDCARYAEYAFGGIFVVNNTAQTANSEKLRVTGAIHGDIPTPGLPHATVAGSDAAVGIRLYNGGAWVTDFGNNNGPGWIQVRQNVTTYGTAPLLLNPRSGNVAVNATTDSATLFGVSAAYALRVAGVAHVESLKTNGAAAEFHRDLTGLGTISGVNSALQVGFHTTTASHGANADAGASILFFVFDNAASGSKQFVGRVSGMLDAANTAGAITGGVAVHVRTNNADGSAATLAARWKANTNYEGEGYQRLGSGAPLIKMKKLTGTTNSAENGTTNIAHGLTGSKIIGFTCSVAHGASSGMPPGHTYYAGYQYDVFHDGTNFVVANHATNSENILSKGITILVTYEE